MEAVSSARVDNPVYEHVYSARSTTSTPLVDRIMSPLSRTPDRAIQLVRKIPGAEGLKTG
ncbi:hypothetical protein PAXRUDRAFT_826969 [Paxillus rubicundulus Ve08.2h10]|uniref:Uncharacterized protein n=1 Tax=Paxillus rubicundulus Ve08.2h10 TaxID=930991 RepID=A0A0D0E972_9AGAM|nr:hypothetical protein PAXRUDRAFT_826969 [Paxillus rubicundulus Ve08.2h10]